MDARTNTWTMKECCLLTYSSWFAHLAIYSTKDHEARMTEPTLIWNLLHKSSIKKMYQRLPTGQSSECIFLIEVSSYKITLACIRLKKKLSRTASLSYLIVFFFQKHHQFPNYIILTFLLEIHQGHLVSLKCNLFSVVAALTLAI